MEHTKMDLKVGDKIKWNVRVGGDIVYTIIDIDLTRDGNFDISNINNINYGQIKLKYQNRDNITIESWGYNYDMLNGNYKVGKILKVQEDKVEPLQVIKKLKMF